MNNNDFFQSNKCFSNNFVQVTEDRRLERFMGKQFGQLVEKILDDGIEEISTCHDLGNTR